MSPPHSPSATAIPAARKPSRRVGRAFEDSAWSADLGSMLMGVEMRVRVNFA